MFVNWNPLVVSLVPASLVPAGPVRSRGSQGGASTVSDRSSWRDSQRRSDAEHPRGREQVICNRKKQSYSLARGLLILVCGMWICILLQISATKWGGLGLQYRLPASIFLYKQEGLCPPFCIWNHFVVDSFPIMHFHFVVVYVELVEASNIKFH